jgi:hypothetical protein
LGLFSLKKHLISLSSRCSCHPITAPSATMMMMRTTSSVDHAAPTKNHEAEEPKQQLTTPTAHHNDKRPKTDALVDSPEQREQMGAVLVVDVWEREDGCLYAEDVFRDEPIENGQVVVVKGIFGVHEKDVTYTKFIDALESVFVANDDSTKEFRIHFVHETKKAKVPLFGSECLLPVYTVAQRRGTMYLCVCGEEDEDHLFHAQAWGLGAMFLQPPPLVPLPHLPYEALSGHDLLQRLSLAKERPLSDDRMLVKAGVMALFLDMAHCACTREFVYYLKMSGLEVIAVTQDGGSSSSALFARIMSLVFDSIVFEKDEDDFEQEALDFLQLAAPIPMDTPLAFECAAKGLFSHLMQG